MWNFLRGRPVVSKTSAGGGTSQATKSESDRPATWRSLGFRKQYNDIESDSTHELTHVEHAKTDGHAATMPWTGTSTVCVGSNGIGKEDSWKMSESEVIRAHTNIEVKVVDT